MTPEQIQQLRQQYNYDPSTLNLGSQSDATNDKVSKRLKDVLGEETPQVSMVDTFKSKLSDIGNRQTETIQNSARLFREGKQGILPTIGQTLGASIGAVGESFSLPLNESVSKAISFVGEYAPDNIKQAATDLVQKGIELNKTNIDAYNALPEETKANVKGVTDLLGGALNLSVGAGSIKPIASVLATGIKQTPKVVGTTIDATKGVMQVGKNLVTPVKTVEQAVGQIAQGGTGALKPVETALSVIDTTKVKTFKDLLGSVKNAIPSLAKQVDDELLKDTGVYSLSQLVTPQLTNTGKTINTNFVDKGLKQLGELYSTIGDDVAKANIDDLITRAKTIGLTRKEVNDISRTYGQEFGSKAFSKLGDPLTSVNAQNFQNVRSGLKDVARKGLGGDEAKILDSKLSALFDTQKLVERNVEAVNKIKQRINERGLLEKAGNVVAKTIDTLSGGTIRGFVGGLLPRGAGYKVMNALDIEDALRANLNVIEKALKQKTDDAFIKVIKDNQSLLGGKSKDLITNTGKATNQTIAPSVIKNSITDISDTIPQSTKGARSSVDNFAIVPPIPTQDENGNFQITPESLAFSFIGSLGLKGLKKTKISDMTKKVDSKMIVPLSKYMDNPTEANMLAARKVGQDLGLADSFILNKENFMSFVNQVVQKKEEVMNQVAKMLKGKVKN